MRRFAPVLLLLASCSSVSDLSGGAATGGSSGGAASKSLPQDEATALRKKADEAYAKKAWADAWNLEAEAGLDRARLERVAMGALEADSGPFEKMFAQLRAKFGGITAEARARVTVLRKKAEEEKRWKDAAQIEIDTAEDPPAYAGAFAVYELTPPGDALAVLTKIRDARTDYAAEQAKAAAPKGGR